MNLTVAGELPFLAPQTVPVTSKADFDIMKSRIASTKAEIRREEGSTSLLHSPDSSPLSKVVLLVCMTLVMKLFLTGFRFVCLTASFFFFQRRRAQSASKVVEKMKKRQAELVSFPAAKIQVFM